MEATTAKRLSHSLRWDKPKRGRRPRRSGVVAGQSRLRWGKPNGGLARSHLEFVRTWKSFVSEKCSRLSLTST